MNIKPEFFSHRRKPNFRLPADSCDAHCHVFGPAARFPYAPNRRYTPADAPKEMLATQHAHLGIDRAVIVQASCHGTDNAAMLDCIASDPRRYRGVAIVDDGFTDKDFDVLDRGGVRGVRFNFVKHLGGAPDMAVFNRVIDRIKRRGWHVVLHVDAPDIIPLSDMMRKLPLPFIVDHMGRVPSAAGVDQPPLRALVELSRLESCWIKVCGSERISMPPYMAAVPIARALVEAARIVSSGVPIFRIPMRRTKPTRPTWSIWSLIPRRIRWHRNVCWWTIRRGFMVSLKE